MKAFWIYPLALGLLMACGDAKPHLEEILERGELRVLSRYGPTSYFVQGDQIAGFEYELAKQFADYLNVHLKIIVPDSLESMFRDLEAGKADLAAAGLTITPARQGRFQFGPVYHEVTQQLVYREGSPAPVELGQLIEARVEVVAGSSHVEQLHSLREELPELFWLENDELDSAGLLELVQLELIEYTIADSNEIAANQGLFPELRVAFDLSDPQPLAWMMPQSEDTTLLEAMESFFALMEASGNLDRLIETYYGHIMRFDYVDTRAMHRRMLTHLPEYQTWFMEAAEAYGFDWRLLAALSYQESHWNPIARSPTGVRGMMMLTQNTANAMEVRDRLDPQQSIWGGARYLAMLKTELPSEIQEPDRTWFALAAYNVGPYHLEDARMLARKHGANPDVWSEVREYLPKLAQKQWYQQTRYGYARGYEPVRFVDNIRRYLDILQHHQYTIEPPNPPANPRFNRTPAAL